jgi:hypothetical protein
MIEGKKKQLAGARARAVCTHESASRTRAILSLPPLSTRVCVHPPHPDHESRDKRRAGVKQAAREGTKQQRLATAAACVEASSRARPSHPSQVGCLFSFSSIGACRNAEGIPPNPKPTAPATPPRAAWLAVVWDLSRPPDISIQSLYYTYGTCGPCAAARASPSPSLLALAAIPITHQHIRDDDHASLDPGPNCRSVCVD